MPRLAGAARRARLRDRRRRGEGRRPRAAAAAGRGRARPALGRGVEVPAHDRGDAAAPGRCGTSASSATCTRSPSLEPVQIGGVTVKLATLHNEEDLARKDVRTGDDVIVLRAGDVIPQVVSPAPHAVENPDRAPPEQPPARCPSCDTPTVKAPGRVFTRCPNLDCPGAPLAAAQALRRRRMDIDGLGEKQVGALQDGRAACATPADFYRLDRGAAASGSTASATCRRENLLARHRGVARAAVRQRALRDRDRGRRLRHRAATSPSTSARSTRCSPRPPSRSPPPPGSARSSRSSSTSSSPSRGCAR